MKTRRTATQERICNYKNVCDDLPTQYPLKNGASNEIGEHCLYQKGGSECIFLEWITIKETK